MSATGNKKTSKGKRKKIEEAEEEFVWTEEDGEKVDDDVTLQDDSSNGSISDN